MTGLIYLRARYMDPTTGTFLTRDPVWGMVGGSVTYNPYLYAHGNSVNYTDPSGMFVCGGLCILAAMTIGGALLGAALGAGIDIGGQLLSNGGRLDCINWGSTATAAIQGAVLGAFGGFASGLGLAMGVGTAFGSAGWAAGFLFEGAIGTAWDMNVNGDNLKDSLVNNFIWALAFDGTFEGVSRYIDLNFRGADADVNAPRNRGGASCPVNSFSADTEVMTPDGAIPISEIEVGDTVLAYNELTHSIGEYTVSATINHEDETIVHLYIDGELIETTLEHPFYTDEGIWVEAGELTVGDSILSYDGDYGIVETIFVLFACISNQCEGI